MCYIDSKPLGGKASFEGGLISRIEAIYGCTLATKALGSETRH